MAHAGHGAGDNPPLPPQYSKSLVGSGLHEQDQKDGVLPFVGSPGLLGHKGDKVGGEAPGLS